MRQVQADDKLQPIVAGVFDHPRPTPALLQAVAGPRSPIPVTHLTGAP
jgi:hypothetical protein